MSNHKGPGHMNNKARARYFARVISALSKRLEPEKREVRIPIEELTDCPDLGIYLDDDTGELVIALGDEVKK